MDVVASISYTGQEIFFIDQERYAHAIGRGLYVYDTVKGPREIIWRHEKEIQHFTSNVERQLLVIASRNIDQPIEVVKLTDQTNPLLIANPVATAIIQTNLSPDADRLVALSDVVDHRVIVWKLNDTQSATVLASKKLDVICRKCLFNPVDPTHIALYGPDGLVYVYVHELFNVFSLKTHKLFPTASSLNGLTGEKITDTTTVTIQTVLWLPRNRLWIVLSDGGVYECNVETKSERFIGTFTDPMQRSNINTTGLILPTTLMLTAQYILVGTTSGSVFWYGLAGLLQETTDEVLESMKQPLRELKIAPAAVHAATLAAANGVNAHTVLTLPTPRITTLALDPTYTMVIVGTFDGQVHKATIDPPATDAANGNGDINGEAKNGAGDEEGVEVVKKVCIEVIHMSNACVLNMSTCVS